MRLSTSNSSYSFLFAGVTALAALPLFVFFLIYSPELANRFHEGVVTFDEYYNNYSRNSTLLIGDNCLTGQFLSGEETNSDELVATRQGEVQDVLELTKRKGFFPRKIVYMEDQSLAIFALPHYKRSHMTKPAHGVGEPDHKQDILWQRFIGQQQDNARKQQRILKESLVSTGKNALWHPVVLRQSVSAYVDSLARLILPNKNGQHHQSILDFYRQLVKYAATGDANYLAECFKNFGGTTLYPDARRWLSEHVGCMATIRNPSPADVGMPCDHRARLDIRYPHDKESYNSYPIIQFLSQARDAGSEITVVILPFNPAFENECFQAWFEPYLRAEKELCAEFGWKLIDMRIGANAEFYSLLPSSVKFFDDVHLQSFGNEEFKRRVVEMFEHRVGQ